MCVSRSVLSVLCAMDLSVDGVHRALRQGLQAGLAGSVALWVLQKIGLISSCCPCVSFLLITILATGIALYVDTLRVRTKNESDGV